MGLSIRAAPMDYIQNNQGDPLQLVVQESESADYELVLELDSHNVFSQSGAGKRKNKRYVCFGKYALDRTLETTHADCPKEIKRVLLNENDDHKKCQGIVILLFM